MLQSYLIYKGLFEQTQHTIINKYIYYKFQRIKKRSINFIWIEINDSKIKG